MDTYFDVFVVLGLHKVPIYIIVSTIFREVNYYNSIQYLSIGNRNIPSVYDVILLLCISIGQNV